MNKKLLINNAYLDDIFAQPAAVQKTLEYLQARDYSDIICLRESHLNTQSPRIVLTGMGSSFHALNPIFLNLLDHCFTAHMVETSELLHCQTALLSKNTLVIIVSQSGQSVETVQLLDLVEKIGCQTIGVTNTFDSDLARRTHASLITQAGPESTVSCKTYLASLMALDTLNRLLTRQALEPLWEEYKTLPEALKDYFSRWDALLEDAYQFAEGVTNLFLVGRGSSLAAALTGGLIIKEAATLHSEGMSSAAFRHGPFEMISHRLAVVIFRGVSTVAHLNEKLLTDLQKNEVKSRLVHMGRSNAFNIVPKGPQSWLPIVESLPGQVISVACALHNNHQPGKFHYGSKITIIE